ncbi:peptidoglycan-binding domain-containing protein [Herbidospora sp. RD11066]
MWSVVLAVLAVSVISVLIPDLPGAADDCPVLKRGSVDQPGETPCVEMVQRSLRSNGHPGQRVTGFYGSQTERNIRDFQREHGLTVDGKAGPDTFAALTTSQMALPIGPPICGDGVCRFTVGREVTRQVGVRVAATPELVGDVVIELVALGVCTATKIKSRVGQFACGQTVEEVIDDFAETLARAAKQRACVRISAGLPLRGGSGTLRFLDFAVDTSARCVS